MPADQIIVALVSSFLVLGLIFTRVNPAVLFSSGALAYLLTGLIELRPLLNSYTHPALVTLILLIVISTVFERTKMVSAIIKVCVKGGGVFGLFKTLLATSFLSAFLNNTAVVSVLISGIKNNKKLSAHRLLLPISYAAIIGGTLTLVGTSTNLIINGLVVDQGLPSFTLFSFIMPSLILLGICTPLVVIFSYLFLKPDKDQQTTERQYFVEAKVNTSSPLIGKTVLENGMRNLEHLFLVEIIRRDQLISPVSPNEVIEASDILIFTGEIQELDDIFQLPGLTLFDEPIEVLQRNLVEVVISPTARILGKTIKECDFRATFDAAVVAIRRGDKQLSGKMGLHRIEPGDSLLLATGHDFNERKNISQNFYILSTNGTGVKSGWQSWLLGLGFPITILAGAYLSISLPESLLVFTIVLLIAKVLKPGNIRRRFPFQIILVVGSALAMAQVAIDTGVIKTAVEFLLFNNPGITVWGAFIFIYFLTLILTEVVTNNAAAAVMFPITIGVASAFDVSVLTFIMAVLYGASASFLSPYGYQTNLIVYSAGNYRLLDYLKVGFPISIVYSLTVITIVPKFFPF